MSNDFIKGLPRNEYMVRYRVKNKEELKRKRLLKEKRERIIIDSFTEEEKLQSMLEYSKQLLKY